MKISATRPKPNSQRMMLVAVGWSPTMRSMRRAVRIEMFIAFMIATFID